MRGATQAGQSIVPFRHLLRIFHDFDLQIYWYIMLSRSCLLGHLVLLWPFASLRFESNNLANHAVGGCTIFAWDILLYDIALVVCACFHPITCAC